MGIENVIFDFGGVLMDWNPRYLYRNVFDNEDDMEHFLHHICSDAWNIEQDRGRSLAEATSILQAEHPEHHELIAMYYNNWTTMLRGDIPDTVELLYKLKPNYRLFGLTNWSAETFPYALENYSFFSEFEGIVVSGTEKLIKPDPKIYQLLLERYQIDASKSVFIDDNVKNIIAASELGIKAIHFKNADQLATELMEMGVTLQAL